ncbi:MULTISPECIES: energy transducer TonB [unclassified Azospirillum]|uniref:energy transducer TonB n=1 Tax=unclassified Azospirillum TaxID=2630922 RepID=UPI000B65A8C5|nr:MULTISPECIES: energy transducer TonB [unclassified Azospirillum]SNT19864.1 TonB family C-terminal domain-containing protein [Azospirillum sp. RU38E]SNT31833.1 TonB family C-terminal domain-containing protein [Azospirillum sp. RU37A]
MALLGLFTMGTLASWMLALPHPGDGSRGARQGALILLSAPVPQPQQAVQTDQPVPVTVSHWVPPPPMLRVSSVPIQIQPAAPQSQHATPSPAAISHAPTPSDTGSQGIAGDQMDRRNMDTGRDGSQGGGKVQPASYEAEVLAWINRHKRYPQHAIQARLEGIVGIAVELDNWGRLLKVELLNSSGHRSLDQAALHQVRAAAPYPRPLAADWRRKRIELNLAFSLRDLPAAS